MSNGTDGILFQYNKDCQPYEIDRSYGLERVKKQNIPEDYLTTLINFEQSILSCDEQRLLFRIWLYSIFFESIMPTKPLLLFTGVKGSGKTFAARIIGRLLFGNKFDVNPINDEKDFVANVCNSYLVAFDNADSKSNWLPDHLARISTGQTISKRKYYTTNDLEQFYPRCFLILTARTPKFKRDDVTERLIIFKLERLSDFISESILLDRIDSNRNALLTELFHILNDCINNLRENKDRAQEYNFRMADFASFGWKVSDNKEIFLNILEKITEEQSDFLLEDDPVLICISEWLGSNGNESKPIKAGELFHSLKNIAEENHMYFPCANVISLSTKLWHLKKELEKYFDFEILKKKGAANEYIFTGKQHIN
ncbi:hypothetical protein GF312_00545 [Candidatus Poribacteria bacterium]|nr:hypothetical protein [Candidatus Poribacteria bacterium]